MHCDVFLFPDFRCAVYHGSLYCTGFLRVKLRRERSRLPSGRVPYGSPICLRYSAKLRERLIKPPSRFLGDPVSAYFL